MRRPLAARHQGRHLPPGRRRAGALPGAIRGILCSPSPGELAQALDDSEILVAVTKKTRAEGSRPGTTIERAAATARRTVHSRKTAPSSSSRGSLRALQHRNNDPACPQRGATHGTATNDDTISSEVPEHSVHCQIYAVAERTCLFLLVGTACARCACGRKWYEAYCTEMKHRYGVVPETVTENAPFPFGPGKRLYSKFAVIVLLEPGHGEGCLVARVSAIDEGVPALLAKSVVQQHGGVIGFNAMTLEWRSLGTKRNSS